MTELELAAMVFADSFKFSELYLLEDFKEAFVESFEAGAEWQSKQSPWISVEERLPETNNGQSLCAVLIKTCDGGHSITANICVEFEAERGYATHWMYIPEV